MEKCKLTISGAALHASLVQGCGIPGFSTCPLMQEGQVFYASRTELDASRAAD